MSAQLPNPYLDPNQQPTPVRPTLSVAQMQFFILAIAIAGCFLPAEKGCNYQIPPNPFVDPDPQPKPQPEPQPKPQPEPVVDPATTQNAWLVVIEETQDRTPEIARVLTDRAFWDGLHARGLHFRLIDRDSPDAANYVAIADALGLPALLILMADGKLISKTPLPKTVADLDALTKRVTAR